MPNITATEAPPITIIKPKPAWKLVDFQELAHYRDLFYFLVLREIQVRYKQTVLGGLWAILQPIATMVVFSLFFGRLAKVPSDGIPYPIFSFAAVVPWTYFSNSLNFASNSLVSNQAFISKVYFPRIAIPIAPIIGWLLDFGLAMLVLFGMMAAYGVRPTALVVMLPVLVMLMIVTVTGMGLWLAAVNVQYRDFRYVVPFMVQLWMFVSPVVYPVSMLPARFRLVYALNPMTGVIEGFRAALLGTIAFPWGILGISAVVSTVLLIGGLAYFRSVERRFADVI